MVVGWGRVVREGSLGDGLREVTLKGPGSQAALWAGLPFSLALHRVPTATL